ncbi:hypothetical protein EDD18DRAFT_1333021 [Armillaria luteobubalina]|uniref:Uncharacterized protein n=1 Tax=Armillaria luteobubalina TaxID=153913 RepID=A0AA39Q395_9AGAR|nr:hypothetical protein EDD18DRAFT_1333021 [Armillaria luteobubalina]
MHTGGGDLASGDQDMLPEVFFVCASSNKECWAFSQLDGTDTHSLRHCNPTSMNGLSVKKSGSNTVHITPTLYLTPVQDHYAIRSVSPAPTGAQPAPKSRNVVRQENGLGWGGEGRGEWDDIVTWKWGERASERDFVLPDLRHCLVRLLRLHTEHPPPVWDLPNKRALPFGSGAKFCGNKYRPLNYALRSGTLTLRET